MLTDEVPYEVGATLGWVLIAEGLRRAEVPLLQALALVRGVEPDVNAASAVVLAAREVDARLAAIEELEDRVEQLRFLAAQVRPGEVDIRLNDLQLEAETALSAGVADIERVETLARCLPIRGGFQALAAALRDTDLHASWGAASIGQLLASFRDADPRLVRDLTGLAMLSPDTRWDRCDAKQIVRLALVLERHGAASGR